MKQNLLMASLLLLASMSGFAEEEKKENVPRNCMYIHKGGQRRALPCTEVDTTLKRDFANACIFKDNLWQIGKLTYNKKQGKHTFSLSRACDVGIYVMKPNPTLETKSPSIVDYLHGRKDLVDKTKKTWISKVTDSSLSDNEVPSICFLSASGGVPSAAKPCSNEPNEVGFCSFRKVDGSFKGNWWVYYAGPNQSSLKVCQGGIAAAKLDQVERTFGDEVVQTIVKKGTAAEFISLLPQPQIEVATEMPVEMSACIYINKGKTTRQPCSNQKTAGFDYYENDIDLFRAKFQKEAEVKYANDLKVAARQLRREPANQGYINQLEAVEGRIDEYVANEIAKLNNLFPVNRTPANQDNACFVKWTPETGSIVTPYIVQISKGRALQHHCVQVEYVQQKEIQE